MTLLQEKALKQYFSRYKNSTREELEEELLKKHSDVEIFLYDLSCEEEELKQILNLTDKEFQSVDGQNKVQKYREDIHNANEFLFNESEIENREIIGEQELIDSMEEDGQFDEEGFILEEMRDLIEGFISLPKEHRKIFHESVKYVIEFDKDDSYEYDIDSNNIVEEQQEHKTMLEDMQKQMVEMTKMLMEKNTTVSTKAEEQQVVESKSQLSVADFTAKYGKSRETQRQWRSRIHNSLPHRRFNGNGRIYYNAQEVEEWLENNS